jgi:hypothetical protein
MMGLVLDDPLPTYPDGFPEDVLARFEDETGRGVIGNRPASGTEIIEELGPEQERTGAWILYTSADSVFQVAANTDHIPLDELYEACKKAHKMLIGEGRIMVERVIARPFHGSPAPTRGRTRTATTTASPRRPRRTWTGSGTPGTRSSRSARSGTSSTEAHSPRPRPRLRDERPGSPPSLLEPRPDAPTSSAHPPAASSLVGRGSTPQIASLRTGLPLPVDVRYLPDARKTGPRQTYSRAGRYCRSHGRSASQRCHGGGSWRAER